MDTGAAVLPWEPKPQVTYKPKAVLHYPPNKALGKEGYSGTRAIAILRVRQGRFVDKHVGLSTLEA
jgi:hypothetical protein